MYFIERAEVSDHPALLAIWESSVKETHHFLAAGDIDFFKRTIQEQRVFEQVNLVLVRDTSKMILGFMGIAENSLEMIFLHPAAMGKGIGKLLLQYAINELKINRVDVNEQNEHALRFYEHFGFTVMSRSELDGTGKPYPILHLKLQDKNQCC